MKLRIVRDSLAERRQGVLVLRAHQHRRVAIALRRARERVDINPDLRFKRFARRVKQTDNRVIRCLNSKTVADVESLEPLGYSLRNDSFRQSWLEEPARNCLKSRSQLERHWTNTTHRHIRALAHSLACFVDQRDELARGEWFVSFTLNAVEKH